MKDLVSVLGSFDEATIALSGQRYETASLVIPLCYALKQCVAKDRLDSDYASTLRSALRNSVDYYLEKYDYVNTDVLSAITFLDPR